jgi:hypothetical protein
MWLSAVLGALLLGGAACVDRERPFSLGPGNGIGPISFVPSPEELDTVLLGQVFNLDVRVEDEDGIDSVWVTLDPNVNTLDQFDALGVSTFTVQYSVLMPDSMPGFDTLYIRVQARDILGDTGEVHVRRVLIE